eukprot:54865_1
MAPLLLLVLHLYLTSLMLYVSLLVSLYLQAKQHYQIKTLHDQQQTTNNKQPTNNHIQLQYHISMVQFIGTLMFICISNNKFNLSHHTHFHIIYLFKIMSEMVKIYIIMYYLQNFKIHKLLNELRGMESTKNLTILYHSECPSLLSHSQCLTLLYTEFILSRLLLLVYIYLFLKERRIFILIISMVQQN